MFRYRWFYRDVLEPRGLVVPLGYLRGGHRRYPGQPSGAGSAWAGRTSRSSGLSKGGAADGQTAYLNQLQSVDNEARKGPRDRLYALYRRRRRSLEKL